LTGIIDNHDENTSEAVTAYEAAFHVLENAIAAYHGRPPNALETIEHIQALAAAKQALAEVMFPIADFPVVWRPE
jgi:recombinational DNA repair protein RecR